MINKKTVSLIVLLGIISPCFSFAQIQQPENLEEAKELGQRAVEVGKSEFPGIIQQIWRDEALPIWQAMWGWFDKNIWQDLVSWFKAKVWPEVEERKPVIKEEFEKEKEEAKEEIPRVTKSLWEKFKELIR